MVKKGKFKLLSFLVENQLVYYKSLNKNKKLVAFSIIETNNLLKIIPVLNELLKKRFLLYYSIQINIPKKRRKLVLLNFIGNDKNRIVKFFSLIHQQISDCDKDAKFLKNRYLKRQFLHIISNKINVDINTMKLGDSLILKHDEDLKFLHFYQINCLFIENKSVSLHNLLKLLNNFNRKGFLIFNIKVNNKEELKYHAYFIDIKYEQNNNSLDIKKEVNSLFNCELFKNIELNSKLLYSILWRVNISEIYYNLENGVNLFLSLGQFNFQKLSKFNTQFEKALKLNQINFHRLNRNLLMIEDKILFLIFKDFHHEDILRLIEKFYSRYFIIILILNQDEYKKLLDFNKIKFLENIKTLNYMDFMKLNLSVMKNEYVLKNS
jgi:hypothetical protein